MAWQCISPEVNVKGFKKCCISQAVGETDDMLWDGSEEDGNIRSECEEYMALTVKMKTGTLTGKVDRVWNVLCLKCTKLIVKYFFLAAILFLGSCLRYG
jgi:hypothetical protein